MEPQDKYNQKLNVKRADERIVTLNNNGGGPIRWQKFYGGSTVDAFSRPGASRAVAVLDRYGNLGVAASQGSPQQVKRPPQFDYVYKAQDKRKADAKNELNALVSKRADLDARDESSKPNNWRCGAKSRFTTSCTNDCRSDRCTASSSRPTSTPSKQNTTSPCEWSFS